MAADEAKRRRAGALGGAGANLGRGPLTLGEARDVVSYWTLLELFETADWRAKRSEFVEVERWRAQGAQPQEAEPKPAARDAKEAAASSRHPSKDEKDDARAEPPANPCHQSHSLPFALEAPDVVFGRETLRPPQGAQVPRPMPFFTVYLGILPKSRLYGHMMRLLEAADLGKALRDAGAPPYAFYDQIGEDPSLRGDAFLAAFHLSPWGKLVPESFTVSGFVGALNLAHRRLRLLSRLDDRIPQAREKIAALRASPVFTVETALKRCEKLQNEFARHAREGGFLAGSAYDGRIVESRFDRKDFKLYLSDTAKEAKRVDEAFIEHVALGVAGFMGYAGEVDVAVRTVFHRPDHPFGPEDLVSLSSFYLSDLAKIGTSLAESGASPSGSPLGDALLEAAAHETAASRHKIGDDSPGLLPKPRAAKTAPLSPALSRFLFYGAAQGMPRVDLLETPHALARLLDPALLPAGRWPSDPSHHLYVAQQAAVNVILALGKPATPLGGKRGEGDEGNDGDESHLSFGPIASVNGPPGTGKSWMLRDVVAEAVVRRARRIAALKNSAAAFDFDHPLEIELGAEKKLTVTPLQRDIAADGIIVVASNNNAAIRNITDELPKSFSLKRLARLATKRAQDESVAAAADGEGKGETEADAQSNAEAAGAAAEAALKQKAEALWLGFPGGDPHRSAQGGRLRYAYWRECALAFARASRPKARLAQAPSLFGTGDDASLENVWGLISVTLGRKANRQRFVYAVLEPRMKDGASGEKRRESVLNEEIARDLAALKRAGISPELYWRAALERFQALDAAVAERRAGMARKYAAAIAAPEEERRKRPAVFETPLAKAPAQHKTSLWVDEDFEVLRSTLFLAALDLMRATILAQSSFFKSGLEAVGAYLKCGVLPRTKGRPEALWALLSMLVPVISTTLASAARMFAPLGPETIGWVLLDEASQASPQAAAGLLNRARRVVVLGDPRQLMPVVTMPARLCDYLRLRVPSVDPRWSPHASSLQTLVDNTMPIGASIRDSVTEENVWTGLPLRTHRRCASPMFDIANALSYANQMVQMTPRVDAAQALPSLWLDVRVGSRTADARRAAFVTRGLRVDRHLPDAKIVPEEMSVLRAALLSLLARPALKDGALFVVSPFRSVADFAARVIEDVRRTQVTPAAMRADTVHAFQGQEADVVVFVLGSAQGEAGVRQRRWAANPTNLLNVAVTRARRGLIVIGNRDAWTQEKSFAILASHLSVQSAEGLAAGHILAARR